MATIRSGIKIISDVSKRQGLALLQKSLSAEHLLALRGNRSAPGNRSKSPPGEEATEGQHMTQLVAGEKTSWFALFNTRQKKREIRTSTNSRSDSSQGGGSGRRFLVPNKGPQTPNRYLSTEYCQRDPPARFQGPPPSLRDCHKDNSKPCFQDAFKPKVVEEKVEEKSGVACGTKLEKLGMFCEKKSKVEAFSLCPKPVIRPPIFKCPEPIPIPRAKKQKKITKVEKCDEPKPAPFKICPRPPQRKMQPMCLVLSGQLEKKIAEQQVVKPPPTPRRCVCENDPEYINESKAPPLYKINPDIPFPVCRKNQSFKIETYKWKSTNRVCQGTSRGSCSSAEAEGKPKVEKTAACKSISGGPCIEAQSCPFRPPTPPPPPPETCGPVSRPAFPSGTQEPFSLASETKTAPPKKVQSQTPPSKPMSSSLSAPKKVQTLTSYASTSKNVQSLPAATNPLSSSPSAPKKVQSLTSTSKPFSVAASAPKSVMSTASMPKQSASIGTPTASTAGCGAQSSTTSSKPATFQKMPFNNEQKQTSSAGKCKKYTLPGCRPPLRTDCSVKRSNRKPCVKVPVPTPCFTDCYKGPCPPKICNPCPCVHVKHLTECDVKDQTKHLQPGSAILGDLSRFTVPPPEVEPFIDPTLVACCDTSNTQAPQPISCEPESVQPTISSSSEPKENKASGCECSVVKFLGSLMSYLRGECKSPGKPPDEVKQAAQAMEESPAQSSSSMPRADTRSSTTNSSRRDQGPRPPASKKEKTSDGKCKKLKLPGCNERVRTDCTVARVDRSCRKRYPPKPSFSECVRRDFPVIRCTECRIAMKRARSLIELRMKGLRVTPENLSLHCSKCLNPTTRTCESFPTKKSTSTGGSLKVQKVEPPKNPPRPTRDYCGPPSAGSKKSVSSKQNNALPYNTEIELPSKNPECPSSEQVCEDFEPYRMPK